MNKYFSGGTLEKFYQKLLSEAHDNGIFFEPQPKA
jgi:putative hydrolase of HD superfamily